MKKIYLSPIIATILMITILVILFIRQDDSINHLGYTDHGLNRDVPCSAMDTSDQRDKCYRSLAFDSNTSEACLKIVDAKRRDRCLSSLLFLNNAFDCSYIEDSYLEKACLSIRKHEIDLAASSNTTYDFDSW